MAICKTSELIDAALEWAVAKCLEAEGRVTFDKTVGNAPNEKGAPAYVTMDCRSIWVWGSGTVNPGTIDSLTGKPWVSHGPGGRFEPHKNWAQGGPIIEREKLDVYYQHDLQWVAAPQRGVEYIGPTPLIAAMRCYVASKLGDTVDIPEELLK